MFGSLTGSLCDQAMPNTAEEVMLESKETISHISSGQERPDPGDTHIRAENIFRNYKKYGNGMDAPTGLAMGHTG